MKNNFKRVIVLILSVILFFIFSIVEFEPLNQVTNKYLQSAVFVLVFIIVIIKPKLRKKIFYFAFLLFFLMIGLYLLGRLSFANSFGSVGLGVLLITSLSYLPELVKKGYIEQL